jgi:plastocyanin
MAPLGAASGQYGPAPGKIRAIIPETSTVDNGGRFNLALVMKRNQPLKIYLGLFLCMLLAAGCTPGNYDQVSREIEITFHEDGFTPLQWRVPAGETITLQAQNDTHQQRHWILMARPVTLPFDQDDWQNTLVEFRLPAQSQQTLQFTAPQAAGEYDVVCNLDLTVENPGVVGTLIVYRIRELTTTPY